MTVIIVAVLKASLILGLALTATAVAGRARAAIRHSVLALAFVSLLAMPAAMRLLPERPVHLPLPRPNFSGLPSVQAVSAPIPARSPLAPTIRVPRRVESPVSWEPIVGALWAIGACLTLLPLVVGLREVRRIRKRAEPWVEGQTLAAELLVGVRSTAQVSVLLHDDLGGPMTCGVLRPAIVFPREAERWDPDDVRRAMRHELEHVRRADCFVDAVARLTCTVYWFHPLAWNAWRRLRLEAERACDDAVLTGGGAIAYAEQLVALAARVSAAPMPPLLAMAGTRDLPRRISSLLDSAQRRGRAGRAWTTGLSVTAVTVIGFVSPLCAAWQDFTVKRLSFEVASVKENTSGDPFGGGERQNSRLYPGGRITARNYTLRDLILWAYRDEIARSQLSGLAPWMEQRRFDIDARAAEGVIAAGELDRSRAQMLDRMLQTLLEERFQLRVSRQQRTGDLHVLTVAPGGAKLPPSKYSESCLQAEHPGGPQVMSIPANGCHMFTRLGRTGFEGVAVDASDIASGLKLYLGRPVVDRTQLTGLFDADVHWNPEAPTRAGSGSFDAEPQPSESDPDVYTAMREQLGLQLGIQHSQIPMLVIKSAQLPTGN